MSTSLGMLGYLLAVGAGISFVLQQAVNANLRAEIGSPWWAGFISYLGGTVVMLLVALVLREPWMSKRVLQRSHLISWSGGLFGDIRRYFNFAHSSARRGNGDCTDRGRTDARLAGIRPFWTVGRPSSPSLNSCRAFRSKMFGR